MPLVSSSVRSRTGVASLLALTLSLAFAGCSPDEGEPDAGSGVIDDLVAGDAGLFPPPRSDAGPREDAGPSAPTLCPPDDGFEENDERASAARLEDGEEIEAIFCGGEDDWFALEVRNGCQLEVRLRFDPRDGDLDLSLYGPDGTLVGASSTPGDSELIVITTQRSGVYSARVRGGQRVSARYRLRMSSTCAAELDCPADDAYEENDDADSAYPLAAGTPAVGIICPNDDDWFSVQVPRGCVAVADLSFTHASGRDLDLRFLRPDGSDGASSLSTTDNERAVESGTNAGPLKVRVNGFSGATNTYRLVVGRVCEPELACPMDDPFEPNDERASAARLILPVDVPAVACGADEDWYRFSVRAGCTVNVRATFLHADGDLDIELRNSSDTVLASSRSASDDEELSYTATSALTAYLRAYVFQGNGTPKYRLSVEETCPDD